jgi:hypothetical protein
LLRQQRQKFGDKAEEADERVIESATTKA